MTELDKKSLSERDICTKFITPAVRNAGWDELSQIREQVHFTKGRIIVRGKLVTRGKAKFGTMVIAGELSALGDRLEAQLTITHTESRRLLEAVLQDILIHVSHQDIRKDAVCRDVASVYS